MRPVPSPGFAGTIARLDYDRFRAEFPVLATRAYLNAGTDGPLPARSAEATRARYEHELRDIPGRPWLRASVGAWNSEADLERLLAAL